MIEITSEFEDRRQAIDLVSNDRWGYNFRSLPLNQRKDVIIWMERNLTSDLTIISRL